MKQTVLILSLWLCNTFVFCQTNSKLYAFFIKKADSLYAVHDFKNSALAYSKAFESDGWKGSSYDRYNAACSWALANNPDSSFYNLNRIAILMDYMDYDHITTDPDLISLHDDKRWNVLLERIKQNKEKAEAKLNRPLIAQLDTIYREDQSYRKQIGELQKKYGWESAEMKAHWYMIEKKDSLNVIKIKAILDKYGWLGSDVIGEQGNTTLFLVIQHSDKITQEKYLPMMRDAFKNGKAQASSLALLEDRVALAQGKRQIYGSQIGRDPDTNLNYVLPLDDPENVDKRREKVGLQPLAEYISMWQLKWNVEQYKKELPEIEAKQKMKKINY